MKSKRIPVTERTLIQRIARMLVKDGKRLKKLRGHALQEVGEFAIVNERGLVSGVRCIATLGYEIGALKPYEELR